jgi:hypothetical protein
MATLKLLRERVSPLGTYVLLVYAFSWGPLAPCGFHVSGCCRPTLVGVIARIRWRVWTVTRSNSNSGDLRRPKETACTLRQTMVTGELALVCARAAWPPCLHLAGRRHTEDARRHRRLVRDGVGVGRRADACNLHPIRSSRGGAWVARICTPAFGSTSLSVGQ